LNRGIKREFNLSILTLSSKEYWPPLFEKTGMYVDPIRLIKRVPRGTRIDNLKELLTRIVHDFASQVDLCEQSHTVFRNDVLSYIDSKVRMDKKSIRPIQNM
jgi:hypothetical protein